MIFRDLDLSIAVLSGLGTGNSRSCVRLHVASLSCTTQMQCAVATKIPCTTEDVTAYTVHSHVWLSADVLSWLVEAVRLALAINQKQSWPAGALHCVVHRHLQEGTVHKMLLNCP